MSYAYKLITSVGATITPFYRWKSWGREVKKPASSHTTNKGHRLDLNLRLWTYTSSYTKKSPEPTRNCSTPVLLSFIPHSNSGIGVTSRESVDLAKVNTVYKWRGWGLNPEIWVLYPALLWLKPRSLSRVFEQHWKQAGYNGIKLSAQWPVTPFCSSVPSFFPVSLPHAPPLIPETKHPLLYFHVTKQNLFSNSFTYIFMLSAESCVVQQEGPRASVVLPLHSCLGLGLPLCWRRRWVLFLLIEPRNPCFK